MITQRRASLRRALLSAVVAQLLLSTAGRAAVLTGDVQTTAAVSSHQNSSADDPVVLRLHTPCGREHENYCENGGQCMFPQDSDKPSCICRPPYGGPRCLFFTEVTYTPPGLEKGIAVGFSLVMLLLGLVILMYCCAQRRCLKSAPLIKSAPSETSV
ncbi:epigen [Betta splendens]|uniref:Epigen n=1 Tax=Betta splendens TaxID=158456 RepID=A0A6P7NNU1_BETSP|nr:epigen [Betta splendens]